MREDLSRHMAAAIEARRIERFPTISDFAAAAGISPSVLYDARRGRRKRYQAAVKLAIARALDWPPDAIDRLLRGEDPASFPEVVYDDQGRPVARPTTAMVEVELAALRAQVEALTARLDRLDRHS